MFLMKDGTKGFTQLNEALLELYPEPEKDAD